MKQRFAAICLAAGRGKRMESKVQKQYLLLQDKPVLYYALKAFEESPVEEVVLVAGKGEAEYCRKEIVEKYRFTKVKTVVEGGKERYHSVYNGLKAVQKADYVLIHDGARPFPGSDVICNCMEEVKKWGACVVAVPVKDTIKIADERGEDIEATPPRERLWQIQTPQCFEYSLIAEAYESFMADLQQAHSPVTVTDDAMVVEHYRNHRVRLVMGSYDNLKITTPEDLLIAETFLKSGLVKNICNSSALNVS